MKLGDLRCACGECELLAVAPGNEPGRAADLFVIKRPVPVRAWCQKCWPWRREEAA